MVTFTFARASNNFSFRKDGFYLGVSLLFPWTLILRRDNARTLFFSQFAEQLDARVNLNSSKLVSFMKDNKRLLYEEISMGSHDRSSITANAQRRITIVIRRYLTIVTLNNVRLLMMTTWNLLRYRKLSKIVSVVRRKFPKFFVGTTN